MVGCLPLSGSGFEVSRLGVVIPLKRLPLLQLRCATIVCTQLLSDLASASSDLRAQSSRRKSETPLTASGGGVSSQRPRWNSQAAPLDADPTTRVPMMRVCGSSIDKIRYIHYYTKSAYGAGRDSVLAYSNTGGARTKVLYFRVLLLIAPRQQTNHPTI